MFLGHFFHHALHGKSVGDVTGAVFAAATGGDDLCFQRLQLLGVARNGHHMAAILCKALGDSAADSTACSSDDCYALIHAEAPLLLGGEV